MREKIKNREQSNIVKYCFFDIDGVLNKSSSWRNRPYHLDTENVALFCRFIKENNLEPVIVSSWRTGFFAPGSPDNTMQIRQLEEKLQQHDIILRYKTPVYPRYGRDTEIRQLIKYHPCDRYIIIDDDPDEYGSAMEYTVFVSADCGFDESSYKKAVKKLRQL